MSCYGGFVSAFVFAFVASHGGAADRVALVRIAPTGSTLYIASADGSGERAVTQHGSPNYNPAWSPKGDWIASRRSEKVRANCLACTGWKRPGTAYGRSCLRSSGGIFSHEQIVFVSTRSAGFCQPLILDLATRKAKPLTSGHGGDFQPDGLRTENHCVSSDRESDAPDAKGRWDGHLTDLFVIHPDGTGLWRVSEMMASVALRNGWRTARA